jgi:disulfide bond formation protein DsbB
LSARARHRRTLSRLVAGVPLTLAVAWVGCHDSAAVQARVAAGEKVYRGSCAACHAPDAAGRPAVGTRLRGNPFIQRSSEEELVAFLRAGRAAGDPANTTGVEMPPRGGNAALTEQDLRAVVAYLRTLR